jgi:hypothetical protein
LGVDAQHESRGCAAVAGLIDGANPEGIDPVAQRSQLQRWGRAFSEAIGDWRGRTGAGAIRISHRRGGGRGVPVEVGVVVGLPGAVGEWVAAFVGIGAQVGNPVQPGVHPDDVRNDSATVASLIDGAQLEGVGAL